MGGHCSGKYLDLRKLKQARENIKRCDGDGTSSVEFRNYLYFSVDLSIDLPIWIYFTSQINLSISLTSMLLTFILVFVPVFLKVLSHCLVLIYFQSILLYNKVPLIKFFFSFLFTFSSHINTLYADVSMPGLLFSSSNISNLICHGIK